MRNRFFPLSNNVRVTRLSAGTFTHTHTHTHKWENKLSSSCMNCSFLMDHTHTSVLIALFQFTLILGKSYLWRSCLTPIPNRHLKKRCTANLEFKATFSFKGKPTSLVGITGFFKLPPVNLHGLHCLVTGPVWFSSPSTKVLHGLTEYFISALPNLFMTSAAGW